MKTKNKPEISGLKKRKMSKVNLDAMIPRADFIGSSEGNKKKSGIEKIYLFHLLKSHELSIYHLLKKPDFQRETNEWDKERIKGLISSFIERSFIPSIILWENEDTGLIYVIDGAHRLSAIIAYVNNDYGYGKISHEFNRYAKIPEEERVLAEETELYIKETIGSYQDVIKNGGMSSDNLKQAYFDVQVITGDVLKAEDSFFKINAQGVILSPAEKALCKRRDYPTAIATRAIMKGSGGHQYWGRFEVSNQKSVKEIAEEIHEILFEPPYKENAKSIRDNPLGGKITGAMPMIFELVKIVREHYIKAKLEEKDITNGDETLIILEWVRKNIWKVLSEKSGSLGLHPSVYFYNIGNKFIQSAFLGMLQLLIEKDGNNETHFLIEFTKVRKGFEDFIVKYNVFLGQINAKYGSKQKSFRHLKGFYKNLIDYFLEEYPKRFPECEEIILSKIKNKYPFLNERDDTDIAKSKKGKFSTELKIHLRIKGDLAYAQRCGICGGYLHPLSTDFDHYLDDKYNGKSDSKNAQPTHYYCNNSKDQLIKLGIYEPDWLGEF